MSDEWVQKRDEALKNASYVNISWLNISRYLPCKIFDRQIYPYSHYTFDDAKIITIDFITFHYRKGTSLHQVKGREMNLQESEELVVFNSNAHGRIIMIKNLRCHLAFATRPVPLETAQILGINNHDEINVFENDYRPAIRKTSSQKGQYIEY